MINRIINTIPFSVDPEKSNSIYCAPDIAEHLNGDIDKFIEFLSSQSSVFSPLCVTWEITGKCNFDCPFCYIKNNNCKTFSFNEIKNSVDTLCDRGLLLVYLTGGEVLSHPEFVKIYTYLKLKGLLVVLLTNLSLLNSSHIELFKKYPPLRITTSIYGLSQEQFSNATGREDMDYTIVLDNLLSLQEMGINVTGQTPINKLTQPDYLKIADWCYANKMKYSSSNELADTYSGESRAQYYLESKEFLKLKDQTKKPICGRPPHVNCGENLGISFTLTAARESFLLYGDLITIYALVFLCTMWENSAPRIQWE